MSDKRPRVGRPPTAKNPERLHLQIEAPVKASLVRLAYMDGISVCKLVERLATNEATRRGMKLADPIKIYPAA